MNSEASQNTENQLRLGIVANLGQFLVLTLLVFFVGITVGLERNVVPVLAVFRTEVGCQ